MRADFNLWLAEDATITKGEGWVSIRDNQGARGTWHERMDLTLYLQDNPAERDDTRTRLRELIEALQFQVERLDEMDRLARDEEE